MEELPLNESAERPRMVISEEPGRTSGGMSSVRESLSPMLSFCLWAL